MNKSDTTRPAKKPLFYGWIVVGASSLVTLSAATSAISLLSIFVVPLADEFGWSRSVIAGGISGGTLVGILGAVFVGRIVDKHGARKLLAVGCFAQGIATIGLAFTQGLWMLFLLLAIARTNLVAVVSVAAPTTASNWFIRKRSQAIAWVVMGDKMSHHLPTDSAGHHLRHQLAGGMGFPGRLHIDIRGRPSAGVHPQASRGHGVVTRRRRGDAIVRALD